MSREPKYVCACARNLHPGERLPSDRRAPMCVRVWVFVRNGSTGGMRGTNRAEWWEAGVRASLPLPGWMHYLTAESLQAAAQAERSALQSARSLDALISPRCRNPPFAPAIALLTMLQGWSGGPERRPRVFAL